MRPLRIGATMRYSALFVIDAMSPTPSLYQHRGKRLFDLLIALPVLLVFGPTLAVLAVLVRVKLGTPIFFRQPRPGLHGKPFDMVKFRTMTGTLFRFCVSHFHVATSWLIRYAND